MMKTKRACIYPKDVQRITGRSERYGRKLLNKIREEFSKEPHQFISIEEFCKYSGLAPELVEEFITD